MRLPFGPLDAVDGGPITAGFFSGKGALLTLFVNQDYTRARQVTLRLRPDVAPPEIFDPAAGDGSGSTTRELDLDAGGAKLVRWT